MCAARHSSPRTPTTSYRLLHAVDTVEMAEEFRHLRSHEISSHVTSEALSMFENLFGSRSDMGTDLLVRAVGPVEQDPAFIRESSVALSRDLLEATAQ